MASGSQFPSVYIDFTLLPALKSIYVPTDTTDAFGHKRWWGKFFSVPLSDATQISLQISAKISRIVHIGTSSCYMSSFSVTPLHVYLSFQPNRIICSSLTISYLFLNCKPLSLPLFGAPTIIKFDSCRTTNLQALFKAHVRMWAWIPCKHPLLLSLPESLCCSPNGLFVFP